MSEITTTEQQARHVFEQWHQTVLRRDADALARLYAEDATFESPAVWTLTGGETAILRGRQAVHDYFEGFFQKLGDKVKWHRSGLYFFDGKALAWEYPRETPAGEQTDLVEWIDLEDGLIARHRVYWGWVGLRNLIAVREAAAK